MMAYCNSLKRLVDGDRDRTGDPLLAKQVCSGAGPRCVRTVSKPYLFCFVGLAFERKADVPSCCKQTKMKGSDGGFAVVS